MTDEARVAEHSELRWHRTPVIAVGLAGAALLAAIGLAFSRPDVVAIGLPLALTTAWMLLRRPRTGALSIVLTARPEEESSTPDIRGMIDVATGAEWVQLAVDQGERRSGLADIAPGDAVVRTRAALKHSGPVELLTVIGRVVMLDGAWISASSPVTRLVWNAPPVVRQVGQLPIAPRLIGLHGGHEGSRPGQGGDFRDIHRFAPGDELRRVDWRATARMARQPGELLVRRTNALSEASVVIALDTADDLGEVVTSWGAVDPDRSGITSLDLAREAALTLATTAVGSGDRVAFHALAQGGRSVRSGGGARHLARLRNVIAATGTGGADPHYRRTPPVPTGSIVFVLSTFFDGVAAELATRWRAAGHAVVAVDVLPATDSSRLTHEQLLAMRTLLAERTDILAELRHAGIEVVSWAASDVDAEMRLATLRQQRIRAVRG